MCSAQEARNNTECDCGLKHRDINEWKFCVIQTFSIIVCGKVSFCFGSLSISSCFILSASVKLRSRSMSFEFRVDVSGQKKMLVPEGKSGVSQRNSQFQRQAIKCEFGLKLISSNKSRAYLWP